MIYISSSCVKHKKITDSVQELVNIGFKNIELSGGTEYSDSIEEDLLEMKKKFNLNFQCHNYFPPPKEPFVLNLSSTNENIFPKSIANIKAALSLSRKLGANKFGFHAGFYFNPEIDQLGRGIIPQELENKSIALNQFLKAYNELNSFESDIELYIENNVLSYENYHNFGYNPFMLTNRKEYDALQSDLIFNLLFDIAHLKVTCRTLGLDFNEEFNYLIDKSTYIHISNNDGRADTNQFFTKDSDVFKLLSEHSLKDKTITLEIYEPKDKILSSYELLQTLINE